MALITQNFDFNLRRDHQNNLQRVTRLWVGRLKEPSIGYVQKKIMTKLIKDEKGKIGFIHAEIWMN